LPRGLQADGEVDEYPTTFRCPFWIRLADDADFQTIERHLPSTEFPGGRPFVYTIEHGSAWMFEQSHQPYEPYFPSPPPASDRQSTRARREVLKLLMGIAPDVAVDASLVTLSTSSAAHDSSQTALHVADEAGVSGTLYLDSGSHLPVAFTYRFVSLLPQKHDAQIQERFSDYRMVNKVLLPFEFVREEDGKRTSTIKITRYHAEELLNSPVFRQPPPGQIESVVPPMPPGDWVKLGAGSDSVDRADRAPAASPRREAREPLPR
jgi:hypothetical protein